jgi:1-acyl-sn-glycerol-3-phosphate acyltransferase
MITRLFSIFLYLFGGIYFIFFGLYIILASLIMDHKYLYPTLPFLTRIQLLFLGAWVRTKNKIPTDQTYIIMLNHTSFADVFFSVQALNGKYTALLAAFNFKIPIWGSMLRVFKAIPVYRKEKNKAHKAIKNAETIIKELGYNIVIFPEGTRTINGKLQQFKKGGFHMAINTGVPILPIAVKGGFKYKPKTRWYIKPSIIDIEVGQPINPNNYNIDNLDELINKTHLAFKKMLND